MARPETTDDVTNRYDSLGSIELNNTRGNPALLKAIAALIEAVEKAGGTTQQTYSDLNFKLSKTQSQLDDALQDEQRQWDRMDKKYEAALVSIESVEDGELSWEQKGIRNWAKAEGRKDPFIVSEIESLLR
jgi:hypothetical protein